MTYYLKRKHRKTNSDKRERLFHKQNRKCYYCERQFSFGSCEKMILEHFIPRTQGGTHENTVIVLACDFCDKCKGAMLGTTYIDLVAKHTRDKTFEKAMKDIKIEARLINKTLQRMLEGLKYHREAKAA